MSQAVCRRLYAADCINLGVYVTEMQQRLKEFAKLYDVIKNERNKIVNQIQTSTQVSAEMREKIKILANEMEILRTAVAQKERYVCVHYSLYFATGLRLVDN